ncbi:MAG: hypothetical protein IJZ83_06500 [Clostridia bacterium]|nr:hypothetical protein [Clostridia bacterium]
MKFKRIISTLLAVLMLASCFTIVMSAEETGPVYTYNTSNAKPTMNYFTGEAMKAQTDEEGNVTYKVDTGNRIVYSAEDKLATMDLRFEKDGYQLYVDEYSGEVATKCIATGEILFSNPYNIADSTAQDSIKTEIMSQIIVEYTDIASGDSNVYTSYEWAASRGQIIVRNIKNGIRVEYTIGREEARMLVPRQIEKSSFEKKIKNIMETAVQGDKHAEFLFKKLMAYYTLQDPSAVASTTLKTEMEKAFPITKKMAVYVLDSSTSQTEMANIEQLIKTYCPDYTYEELDEDHMLTEYESEDKNPPLFKMALEYSLDELGMTVRLPANGIRFNESLYQLESIQILPYMGAGAFDLDSATSVFGMNSGYTFFPDGSGALFDFEEIENLGQVATITGKVYGQDYAYHEISGTHQEILRYPVFGIVNNEDTSLMYLQLITKAEEDLEELMEGADPDPDKVAKLQATIDGYSEMILSGATKNSHGFVAIVEEGDALMELSSYHAVRTSEYNTVKMTVYPRPKDTYNVADSISVGQNDTWTVVSSRKYTGNYKVRYVMLTEEKDAEAAELSEYYDCSYVGMAKAYREYLESQEILTRIEKEDVNENIPIYIEAFGALETTERYLSIPVDVMTPLTTFDDIKTMYDELSEEGVENINFILNGFTKGGISSPQVPYNLKWENAVEDDMDFEDLLAYAREEGFGVYPDFDFVYAQTNGWFDGLSLKNHAVKTIDNRYTSRREYSATKQTYISYFDLALSPAYFSHFYEKLTDNFLEFDPMGISVSTLGAELNSDFDEDEPYNREDSKNFTVKAFEYLDENYDKVMTSGGNAYTWKYVDYITDIALDSSRFSQASASVPFLGMVLHGYVEIAGTPINMEGNIDYAILKAIENGASLKFILSYRNTNNLKNYVDLSQYYSVRYDIWFDDVVDIYDEVNSALSGVQSSTIVSHKFIEESVRVPDDDELIANAQAAIDAAIDNENGYKDSITQADKDANRNARLEIEAIVKELEEATATDGTLDAALAKITAEYNAIYNDMQGAIADKVNFIKGLDTNLADYAAQYSVAVADLYDTVSGYVNNLEQRYYIAVKEYLDLAFDLIDKYTLATGEYMNTVKADDSLTDAQKANIKASIDAYASAITNIETKLVEIVGTKSVNDIMEGKINGSAVVLRNFVVAQTKALEDPNWAPDVTEDANKSDDLYFCNGKFSVSDFEYEPVVKEEVEPIVREDEVETPDYASDKNKVVFEVYENGTAFLLNFNNYRVDVKVEINGEIREFTIGAYGYIMLTGVNA